MDQEQIKKIKNLVEEFFEKMTIAPPEIEASILPAEENKNVVDLEIKLDEPQILIGQQGQTLFEIQHLLRMVINKKLNNPQDANKIFYLNLDINDYKKKKVEYLKDLAKSIADQVSLTKEEKALLPMSSYERRIIHAELSLRQDVSTESQGEGLNRHIVIKSR